jgi:hypothetical protein
LMIIGEPCCAVLGRADLELPCAAPCCGPQVLDLSHNSLVSLRGVEGLANLRELRVAHNRLGSLAPLAGLAQLQVRGVGRGTAAAGRVLVLCKGQSAADVPA